MLINDAPSITDTRRLPAPDRSLKLTPLDLRQMKLSTAMRGFDKTEVTTLMLEAAEGFEQALRDNERLRQDLVKLEASLTQYRELEGSLKGMLISAQKVSDDMRESAAQEAARIIREAEGKAELIIERVQARAVDMQREVDNLRMARRDAESGVESIVAALRNTIHYMREQEQRDSAPDNIVPHRPRVEAAG